MSFSKSPAAPARLLDATAWRILEELQRDARLSFAELGRRVGLSTPATAERVRNLESAGILAGYRAEIDLARVGLPILAVVRMSAVAETPARITAAVQAMPEILECHRATGADAFIMKVAVASVEHLEALIDRLTPFGATSTAIVLSSPVPWRAVEPPTPAAARPATDPRRRGER